MGKDARGSSVVVIHSETHYFRDPGIRGAGKKPEYDFSKGVRGKLFRPDAEARLPVYLDREVQRYLVQRAADKGTSIEDMVNDLLKREIEIIEPVK